MDATRSDMTIRAIHRVLGTVVGLGLYLAIAAFGPSGAERRRRHLLPRAVPPSSVAIPVPAQFAAGSWLWGVLSVLIMIHMDATRSDMTIRAIHRVLGTVVGLGRHE
jgi:uncharacterized membrane protein YccC